MSDQREGAGGGFRGDVSEDETLRRYRTLATVVDAGVYQLDADGRFVAVDDQFVDLTGYDRDDLVGEHVSLLLDDRAVEHLERTIQSRLETDDDAPVDVDVETATGERVPCEVRLGLLTTDGSLEGTVGTVRATENRERRDVIGSTDDAYESITSVIDEADVGVFVLDEAFDVVWIDESIERYFGVDRRDVVGRDKRTVVEETIADRVDDADAFAETVFSTYDDNTYVEQFECRITPGDGREERWLEHRSTPLDTGRYAGGRVELYYDITDRKRSERAREESEQQFQSLVNAVDEYAIFMLDPEGRVVNWNEGARRIKGYDAEEIVGDHFSTFYTDDARANGVPERNLERARTTGSVEDEGWRLRSDGTTFWADVTITAIRSDGELQGYAKVTRDMTDRRERERQLQRERDLTEQILNTSPVGIAVLTADGSISRANERMEGLLGLSADAGDRAAVDRDVPDADDGFLPIDARPAARVFETGTPVSERDVRIEPPDGERTWLSIDAAPVDDTDGTPDRVVVIATDVTELKALAERRKRELEEREKELAAVQLATNLLVPDDRPFDELLQEFVTKLPRSFRRPGRTAARAVVGGHEATTDAYEPTDRRTTATTSTANGTRIEIDVAHLGPVPDSDRSPFLEEERALVETLARLVQFHVERREYIEDLRAETRRLEQFAYAASHDLQEPLRMVSSYLQLIQRRYEDALDEDGQEFLAFAIDGADRMRDMIEGLLEYARVETQGEPLESIDLESVLDDVLTDLELKIAEHDAAITADDLPHVRGDASQLRQVFLNLLENAIEYSGAKPPRIHVTAERGVAGWTISVRDEGIGIAPDDQDQVFEVFERLHTHDEHPGTGIGLALCQRIVERHGGDIWIDSEPGEGTTVSFTLPAASDGED